MYGVRLMYMKVYMYIIHPNVWRAEVQLTQADRLRLIFMYTCFMYLRVCTSDVYVRYLMYMKVYLYISQCMWGGQRHVSDKAVGYFIRPHALRLSEVYQGIYVYMYGGQRHISDKALGYLSDRTLFPATRRINWSELFPKSTELVSLFPHKKLP